MKIVPRFAPVAAVLLTLAAGCSDSGGSPSAPDPSPANTDAGVEDTTPAEPTFYEPDPEDFQLDVRVLTQECFGSAGCNVTFRIELGYSGGDLDPDAVYEVTYEVEGGEDPLVNTLTVSGDSYSTDEEEFIQTVSGDDELTAVVANVEQR